MASVGINPSPPIKSFSSAAVSVMTVNFVASEPVPAVDGMQTTGATGPSIARPRNAVIFSPVCAQTAMAFAASSALPPPKPMAKSHSSC